MIVTEVGVTTFVSKLMGAPVMDQQEVLVGRLQDFVLQAEETGVRVTQIVVSRHRQQYLLPSDCFVSIAPRLMLHGTASLSVITDGEADQLRLVRDVLDAQVIDPDGAKVIRVNDVQLDWVDNHLVVSGLDIGLWGISRRLGLAPALATLARLFHLHIPEGVLPWKDVAPIAKGFHHLNLTVPKEQVERMHPADLARIVAELGHSAREALLNNMTVEQMADVVEESDSEVAVAILDDLDDEKAADVLDAMEPDEAADVLADVPEEDREKLMNLMEPEGAQEVRELMLHPEGTAGAIMNTNFWSLPPEITVGEALRRLRTEMPVCDEVLHVYVMDAEERLKGVATLRHILQAVDETPLADVMDADPHYITADAPEEEVALLMTRYNILGVPVLEEETSKLVGVVTIYDLLDQLLPHADT